MTTVWWLLLLTVCHMAAYSSGRKGKDFPYSLPSVRPGADPSVQAGHVK